VRKRIRRREFITLFRSTAAAWPMVARAQQPSILPRIGFLHSARNFTDVAFRQGLRETGFIEGQTS
jgi:putative tryptophan/tyrosine transport system substrate-binding protein